MIEFSNGGRLVERVSELPNLRNSEILYADFETTSHDPKLKSTDPWHNCWTAGIGLTVDDSYGAWYVPVGHSSRNLPKDVVMDWWLDIVSTTKRWTNHNVKYDAHVSTNDLGVLPECELECTLTSAKIIDSDRVVRGGYGLDALSVGWLKEDIISYKQAMQPYLAGAQNKDYGLVPADLMGEYCCQDVITNRRLKKYIDERMPSQCELVRDVEIALTTVLFEIERVGLRVKPMDLKRKEVQILQRLLIIHEELERITGSGFRPHVNADCFDVLCNQYGLPVVAWTESDEGDEPAGNPSFSKDALKQYLSHPYAPTHLIELMLEYREKNTLLSFFVRRYQELETKQRLHATYNQSVRTGRMSAKRPNTQQLSGEAKELIVPPDGYAIITADYSQIEFRLIVHYINDFAAIEAYANNPDTDFHSWVAEMCGIPRKPAKSVNFCMGYGGGKVKVLKMLAGNLELVGDVKMRVDELLRLGKISDDDKLRVFDKLCARRAEEVYQQYHDTLPSLKTTSRRASRSLEAKGYVFNIAGRHRHLPIDQSYRTFNSLNQSSAADIQKERLVAVANACRGTPISVIGNVHDETVFHAPIEVAEDPRTARDIIGIMEDVPFDLRVPIRCSFGVSRVNWYEASESSRSVDYDRDSLEGLKWLKVDLDAHDSSHNYRRISGKYRINKNF